MIYEYVANKLNILFTDITEGAIILYFVRCCMNSDLLLFLSKLVTI